MVARADYIERHKAKAHNETAEMNRLLMAVRPVSEWRSQDCLLIMASCLGEDDDAEKRESVSVCVEGGALLCDDDVSLSRSSFLFR